jgi:hypothetical protein
MEDNQTQDTQQTGHLLDTTADNTAPVDTVPTAQEQQQGEVQQDRPEWLPEKFKSPEDLAKSYTELEKKVSGSKAPETYDWSMTKDLGLEEVTPELDKEISQVFKQANFTQDQVKTAMALYSDQMAKLQSQMQAAPVADLQAESSTLKKSWGDDYQTRLESVKKFSTTLPERVLNMPLIDTAEGIQFLESLMENNRMPNPISNTQAAPTQDINSVREQIREMRADPKFKLPPGDPVNDAHMQKLYSLYELQDRLQKRGN